LIDVAELEESLDDVAVRLGLHLDERGEHDDRTAGLILPSDVAHSRVQQQLDHIKLTIRHGVVKRRVTLTKQLTL